jgi:lysyl-tRNA synthetase class 2
MIPPRFYWVQFDPMDYTEVERDRLAKLKKIKATGIDPYPPRQQFHDLRIMAKDARVLVEKWKAELPLQSDEDRQKTLHQGDSTVCAIMGRVVARRLMGKASFTHIEDGSGRIQIYARIGEDSIDAATFERFKDLDLGDFI